MRANPITHSRSCCVPARAKVARFVMKRRRTRQAFELPSKKTTAYLFSIHSTINYWWELLILVSIRVFTTYLPITEIAAISDASIEPVRYILTYDVVYCVTIPNVTLFYRRFVVVTCPPRSTSSSFSIIFSILIFFVVNLKI